jgi:hypothetical protein
MEANKCINCEQPIENNFCSNCGQRTDVKRISFREGWNDFWARIYGFDGMFPRTLRDLTLRPGKVAKLFIEGNRARYYGPVGYFFLMITLFLLVMSLLDIPFLEYTKSITKTLSIPTVKENSETEKFMKIWSNLISDNMKLFSFVIIPFFSLSSKWLFSKSKLNYLEHSVMPFYIQGHVYWMSIISLFVYKTTGSAFLMSLDNPLTLVLFGIGAIQLFNYQKPFKAFIKGILVFILGFIMYLMGLIIFVLLFFALNPTYLEMIRPSNNR